MRVRGGFAHAAALGDQGDIRALPAGWQSLRYSPGPLARIACAGGGYLGIADNRNETHRAAGGDRVMTTPTANSRQLPEQISWREVLAFGWKDVPEPAGQPPPAADPRERIAAAAAGELAVLPIPAEFGGGGGDLITAASAQRQLGRSDPSVAVALNMHM